MTDIRAFGILVALTAGCLLPFLGKAFHIDEPLFVWTARQIQHQPLDYYGFAVNWDGVARPMAQVTQNPPLAAYYLALLAAVVAWNEYLLHLGFLLPALALVWGTFRLAREMSLAPRLALFAALVVVSTPVFLIAANSVMCDVSMLALWTWSIVWWRRGLRDRSWRNLLAAGLAVTACALTKYFGIALVPLLVFHGLVERRRPGPWLLVLSLPLAGLAAYHLLNARLYGEDALANAAAYALGFRVGGAASTKTVTGLAFIGGGLVAVIGCVALLGGTRVILWSAAAALVPVLAAVLSDQTPLAVPPQASWGYLAQAAVMVVGGSAVLVLAVLDARQRRDADAYLLLSWIFGVFAFTCYVNWTVSGRNVLPMAPAVGLLLARRRVDLKGGLKARADRGLFAALLPALALSLLVAWADYRLAESARQAAREITRSLSAMPGTIWFQGHWGFQYYMERSGAKALDMQRSLVAAGDVVIIPANNSYTAPPPPAVATMVRSHRVDTPVWLSTMNSVAGAGFYSDGWGALPFVFGRAPKEAYHIYVVR